MKKSIIAIIIALNMLLCTGYKAYASGEVAAALAVAGGSIGTAGLAVGSIPALPIAAGLAAGAMIAVGINIAISDASKQEGMTKSQYMQAKLEEWGQAAGKTKNQIADAILSGATVARDGTIYLGKGAGKLLSQFGNWLWGTDQVQSIGNDNGVTIGNYTFPLVQSVSIPSRQVEYEFSKPVALVKFTTYKVYYFSNQNFTYEVKQYGNVSSTGSSNESVNGYYYRSGQYSGYIDIMDNLSIPSINDVPMVSGFGSDTLSMDRFLRSLDGTFEGVTSGSIDDGFVGDEDDWEAKGDVLLPADGEAIALSPGLLGTIADQIGDIVKDGTIAVKDYVDAVIDAVNDLPIDIPVTDDKTGVIEIPQIPAIPYEDTASIEDVPDTDIPTDKDPIVDPTLPVLPDGGGVDALGDLTLDLKSVFPFCLPFDAVDMIKLLNVPAQAPFYHVHVPIPIVNESIDFDIDLTPFDSVAAVARKMEIILFCVGLALTTRQIIRS